MLWPEHSYRQVLLHKIFRAESDRTRNGSREPNSICPTIAKRKNGRNNNKIKCSNSLQTPRKDNGERLFFFFWLLFS